MLRGRPRAGPGGQGRRSRGEQALNKLPSPLRNFGFLMPVKENFRAQRKGVQGGTPEEAAFQLGPEACVTLGNRKGEEHSGPRAMGQAL